MQKKTTYKINLLGNGPTDTLRTPKDLSDFVDK
jgi:hypothetical protein